MKIGQFIEYNMQHSFLKNNTENAVEKLFPDPFLKNQIWVYFWIYWLTFFTICFYDILIWGLPKYSELKLQTMFCYLI